MKPIFISGIYLLILFCLSKYVFEPSYLYYELWWLDIPMHILGGFGIASFVSSILSYKGITVSFGKLCLAYFIIAIIWESWEYYLELTSYIDWEGWLDTVKDVIDGFIGISVAYLFVRK